jgi:hypothetical protein
VVSGRGETRGGSRKAQAEANGKKVGRPAKEKVVLPVLTKQLAIDLYRDKSTKERWEKLRDATLVNGMPDMALRFRVECEIQDQATGKSVQPVDHNPDNKPAIVRVLVEHIGARASHPSPAKTK